MKRKRLKGFVVPVFGALVFSTFLIGFLTISNKTGDIDLPNNNYTYVNESIINDALPTIKEDSVIIKPYQNEEVKIYKKFYDGSENKENAIIYYNGTYMQNSGIIYSYDSEFNVVSVLDGEVIEVKKEELLGYVVEIRHDNNLISTYQGLKSVNVKKGETVTQDTLIGKSGEITLDVNLKNALLFELIKEGKYVNPENYFNKKIKEI